MRRSAPPPLFGREVGGIHCVGIGGMGLGPLAIYLAGLGYRISGEDEALSEAMAAALARAGVTIADPGCVPPGCELVAVSSAIPAEHQTMTQARQRNLPVVRRGDLLAEVTRDSRLVAVCGSHGKTTTTAMLGTALRAANFPAGYIIGGLMTDDSVAPARAGSSDWIVAEIDESDGTIDRFSPEITVVVNLDWDHPDHYRTPSDLEAAFTALIARTRAAALTSDACVTSARIGHSKPSPASTRARVEARRFTFGRTGEFQATVSATSDGIMTLSLAGAFQIPTARVRAAGDFNAANATAALAAAQLMGVALEPDLLAEFPGVHRRQAVLHRSETLMVVEDYAHHPAEIRALLDSLRRSRESEGRLLVVFQPHRFSRTRQFKGEFAAALAAADAVHLLDVYGAGEAPSPGGTSADLYAELRRKAPTLPVAYLPGDPRRLLEQLLRALAPGDLVAFVGAGDIDREAREWLQLRDQELARASRWDDLANELRRRLSPAAQVRREEPLAPKTTLRVGGNARVYVEPADVSDLQDVVREARVRGAPLHVLGRGSNVLVPDPGVDGVVVALRAPGWERFEMIPDGRVRVGAGLRLKNLCGLAMKEGLGGLEFLEGIPGNVGGALSMNAGAMGGSMFDVVDEVDLITFEGERRTLRRAEMRVDYRHCADLQEAIAVAAVLRPVRLAGSAQIERRVAAYREQRQKNQPRDPSAGCIFKNPPGDSAGRLIDTCGLKGERVGDAEVSTVHGNFIVNRGGATSADVIALVRRVRIRVEQQTGVRLRPEVLLYGARWEDVL